MCTPFAHALAGYAVIVLGEPELAATPRTNLQALGTGFVFGNLADADFLVAYYTNHPALQHHYFSHSIPFGLLIGVLVFLFLKALRMSRVRKLTLILSAAFGTHLLLDYFTGDGSLPIGIPLFWPFTHEHFISPVEFFLSIHRGSMEALFGRHNFLALLRETLILGPLTLAAYWKARRRLKVER